MPNVEMIAKLRVDKQSGVSASQRHTQVVDDKGGSLRSHRLRQRASDSATRSRDGRHLSIKLTHQFLLRVHTAQTAAMLEMATTRLACLKSLRSMPLVQ